MHCKILCGLSHSFLISVFERNTLNFYVDVCNHIIIAKRVIHVNASNILYFIASAS